MASSRRAELESSSGGGNSVPAPVAATGDPLQQMMSLLQGVANQQSRIITKLDEQDARLTRLESAPAVQPPIAPDPTRWNGNYEKSDHTRASFMGLLNEEEDGIPDKYYRSQHVCIVGRRSAADVIEHREKLHQAAEAEFARTGGLIVPGGGGYE